MWIVPKVFTLHWPYTVYIQVYKSSLYSIMESIFCVSLVCGAHHRVWPLLLLYDTRHYIVCVFPADTAHICAHLCVFAWHTYVRKALTQWWTAQWWQNSTHIVYMMLPMFYLCYICEVSLPGAASLIIIFSAHRAFRWWHRFGAVWELSDEFDTHAACRNTLRAHEKARKDYWKNRNMTYFMNF